MLWVHSRLSGQTHSRFAPNRRPVKLLAAILTALACFTGVASTALADQTVAYDVRDGDTLFGLGRQFGVSPDAIAALNHLPDPNALAIGQELLINVPAPTGPFGALAPDRRDDNAVTVVDIAFASQLPSKPLDNGLTFGAIVPDRRDDTPPTPGARQPDTSQSATSNTTTSQTTISQPDASQSATSQSNSSVLAPAAIKVIARVNPAPAASPATVRATPAPPPPAPKSPSIIAAPYYSQFDGSIFAESNCGPTTLSMALGALGVNVDQITLRHQADKQMGFENPNDGTTWEALVYAARVNGISNDGLYRPSSKSYRAWSVANLKSELAKGRPVVLLVRYRALPDHVDSAYAGDHYIVALGFDASGNLVYNDPAFKTSPGSDRTIDPAGLLAAWSNTAAGLSRTAMGVYR